MVQYPTEESQIKQTLRLIESLATTPILPKEILDKINFRTETTTNMCKDLETEKDKYKEISSFSDVHDENAKHYYQTMLRYLTGIQLYLTLSNYERSKEKNLENAYKYVFGLILGSFDLSQPEGNVLEKLEFLYNADLFLRNNIKTKRAAEIIVENEEKMKSRKGDGTYGTFLQKLLAFTVCLLREDTAKLGRVNRYHLHEEYVDLHDLYIVLDTWKTTLQGEQDDNVEQEEDTKGEQEEYDNDKNFPAPTVPYPDKDSESARQDWESAHEQNEQSGNNEAPKNISQAEIADRKQEYRKQMASLIDSVNIHWCPIAIQAPVVWYNESLLDVENVTTALKAAMLMHDFYTVSHLRTSKSGKEWDDIWSSTHQITLENTTPNRPFLASVLETLQTSLHDANAKRQSRNEGKTFFFEENSYNRAYQRAIGFALICVKRLLWRWHMDATFQNTVTETANVEQYHGYICHALFLLTIWYRTVACYRAFQDSDQHDLNYADANVKECNITRMQLETPVRLDIKYMGEDITVAKYRLSNPRNKPECCIEYVDQMKGLCERTYNELRDIWRLDATSWHGRAKIYANRILLIDLDRLQRIYIYGTNSVAKRYWSRKWNMQTRRKEAVEEKWFDTQFIWRTQIGMFRPIRMDHTNCLQVAIKSIQFNSTRNVVGGTSASTSTS
jgi:hypothetical protein